MAGGVSGAALLGACGGFSTSGGSSDQGGGGDDTLTFTTWGTDAELAGFRSVISAFEKAQSGRKVTLNVVPYAQMFTTIDAQIQAGKAPDVFRVPYYTLGAYAGRGQLLDLSKDLPSDISSRFTDTAWAAVQGDGKPYGVPHHTDTSCIFYDKQAMASVGVTPPTSVDQAWSWEELTQVMTRLKKTLPQGKYPFAYNWQGNGVTRWLNLLFQADGRFLDTDLRTPAIDSAAGKLAVDFSKSFFSQGLVPPNSSVKSTTLAADAWYAKTVPVVFGGAFLLPDAASTYQGDWSVTFAPRKVRGGGDFGGNALVATATTKKASLAAAFLEFATQADQMKAFCAGASLLPTRKDLTQSGIDFVKRPELSPIFLGQAQQVKPQDAAQVAQPNMAKIITVLKDQLDKAFIGNQSTEATLSGLSSGIASATSA
ncbi:ABC transporter substrate-binding protein [Lapillicoccus jejuensis]|nr:sugar ABC transporter substrate-binding protein [Lapillicoccus jejuensis]